MPATGVGQNGFYVVGYELWDGLTGDGQLSIYSNIQSSLLPYMQAAENIAPNPPSYMAAMVKGFMTVNITNYNPLYLSKFEGYPSRFNFGGWRYLQSNRALGNPRYIDSIQWGDNLTMKMFITKEGSPNFAFPPLNPKVPFTFSLIQSLGWAGRGLDPYSGHTPGDYFSFFLNSEVEASFAFEWFAEILTFRQSTYPDGVYLVNI